MSLTTNPPVAHFAEYLTGLTVAERKNISAINRQFAVTTDQSCLNRCGWSRLRCGSAGCPPSGLVAGQPKTRYSPRGVIAIDNTLVDPGGKLIEDVGGLWDYAHQRPYAGAPPS